MVLLGVSVMRVLAAALRRTVPAVMAGIIIIILLCNTTTAAAAYFAWCGRLSRCKGGRVHLLRQRYKRGIMLLPTLSRCLVRPRVISHG